LSVAIKIGNDSKFDSLKRDKSNHALVHEIRVVNLNLVKTSLLSFIATVIKLSANLVINKFISIFIGPSGLAIIGQFQNISSMIQIASQGGINAGVTKYTSEYKNQAQSLNELWGTSLKITVFFSLVISTGLLIFSDKLSMYVFDSLNMTYVFKVFAFTLIFFSLNQLILSIINGLREIRIFIGINILQSLLGLILTTILVYYYKLDGALVALVTNQSFVFIISASYLLSKRKVLPNLFKLNWSAEFLKRLLNYSLMALTTAISLPLAQVCIRNYVAKNLSWDYAGYWQAMTYISSMYLMVITVALSTYYLPKLSEITLKDELKKELVQGYKIIMPLVIFMAFIVYIARDLVIYLLFSSDFKPMLDLFAWQMVGDVFKIASWLLAYVMVAKAMTRVFIVTEIIFSLSYLVFAILFFSAFGFVGLSYAFAINYIIYFMVMLMIMRKVFFK